MRETMTNSSVLEEPAAPQWPPAPRLPPLQCVLHRVAQIS